MNTSTILTADLLDILFEGRNKEYGAYQLRRTYNKRMLIAVSGMLALTLLLWTGYVIGSNSKDAMAQRWNVIDHELAKLDDKPVEKITPPPIKLPEPKPVAMKNFSPPIITDDKDVKPDEQPPANEDLENVKIGNANVDGDKDLGITAPPPTDEGRGILQAPARHENPDSVFIKVEIESEYPGGLSAWARYLNKGLKYPQEAVDNLVQGTVQVRFIVDKQGNVSNVEAVGGPSELQAEAVRVIKKSGQWTPAIQNGKVVNSFKTQPVVFKLAEE